MKRIIDSLLLTGSWRQQAGEGYRSGAWCRVPELPIGFVRRTDPNFFFLARKF